MNQRQSSESLLSEGGRKPERVNMGRRIYSDDEIQNVLRSDAIHDTEQILGRRWDDGTEAEKTEFGALALNLQWRKVEAENRMLESAGDTTFSMKTEDYIDVVQRLGFRQIFREDFQSFSKYDQQPVTESLFAFFREPALLLTFDSYRGQRNGGNVYYFWKPSGEYPHEILSNTSWVIASPERTAEYDSWKGDRSAQDAIWREARDAGDICVEGSHDCRTALGLNLRRLEQYGEFIPWPKGRFVWLLHHMDTKGPDGADLKYHEYDHFDISYRRASTFPDEMKRVLAVDKWQQKQTR